MSLSCFIVIRACPIDLISGPEKKQKWKLFLNFLADRKRLIRLTIRKLDWALIKATNIVVMRRLSNLHCPHYFPPCVWPPLDLPVSYLINYRPCKSQNASMSKYFCIFMPTRFPQLETHLYFFASVYTMIIFDISWGMRKSRQERNWATYNKRIANCLTNRADIYRFAYYKDTILSWNGRIMAPVRGQWVV